LDKKIIIKKIPTKKGEKPEKSRKKKKKRKKAKQGGKNHLGRSASPQSVGCDHQRSTAQFICCQGLLNSVNCIGDI
jgi:hypothetical protein